MKRFNWSPTQTEWDRGYDEIDKVRMLLFALGPGTRQPCGSSGAKMYYGLREAIRLVVQEGCTAAPLPTGDAYEDILFEALAHRNFEAIEYAREGDKVRRSDAENQYATKILLSLLAGHPKRKPAAQIPSVTAFDRAGIRQQAFREALTAIGSLML